MPSRLITLKSWLYALAAVLVMQAPTYAQAQDLPARLDAVLDTLAEDVPGAILLVDGPTIRYMESRGLSNRRSGAPMRTDHTLRIGSITKTYVAALTLMAADDGLIELDAPMSDYLDAQVMAYLPRGLDPTVRQLLNHTSGVPDYYGVRFYFWDWLDRGPLTTERVLNAIRGKAATGAPGERVLYSNTNYHLIALMLESVHGEPLETLLRERIFSPLGLEQTYYSQMFAPGDDVHGYGGLILPWVDTYAWSENTGPDGGMFASADEVAIWIRALFSPEGNYYAQGARMISGANVERERVRQGMGAEVLVSRSGARVIGHTGGLDGYAIAAFYVPDTDTVFVLFINRSAGDAFNEALGGVLRALLAD
jgi:D-alanyl-D-alanine carboxypeptidase